MVFELQQPQICLSPDFRIFNKSQENQRKSTIGAFS